MNFSKKNNEFKKNNKNLVSKILLTILVTLLISISTFAQQGINYKAIIKDDLGNIIAGQPVRLQFKITETNTTSNTFYIEDQLVTTDANGIVIVTIGEGSSSGQSFSGVPWYSRDFDLEVGIDITGGFTFDDMGRTPFGAVPYAKHALTSGDAVNYLNDLIDARSDNGSSNSGSSLFLGRLAGYNDDGNNNRNASVGFKTLNANTTGTLNVAVGHSALSRNETGHRNVALGQSAGFYNVSGNGNIFIGYNAGGTSNLYANSSNKLYINNGGSNSPLIYGEFDTDLIFINGDLNVTDNFKAYGNIEVTEEINRAPTGTANLVPIAYGTVESNANVLSGTGNFTASINSGVITISVNNETITVLNSTCVVTPYTGFFRISTIDMSGGDVNVHTYNSSGVLAPITFQFVIYKL